MQATELQTHVFEPRHRWQREGDYGWRQEPAAPGPACSNPVEEWCYWAPNRKPPKPLLPLSEYRDKWDQWEIDRHAHSENNGWGGMGVARINLSPGGLWIVEPFGCHWSYRHWSFARGSFIDESFATFSWGASGMIIGSVPSMETAMDLCEEHLRETGVLLPEDH